ncbi:MULTISPECIES: type VI secretion system baseplate subunit TssG [Falsihalocynthiibacter]|uniref:type VI secretion system baseplate subunit TssG n=1 Tax=Falsihalocynthiibacter TaxID=2854182 RepID=UPI003003A3BA
MTHFENLTESPESHHIFLALRIIEAQFPDSPELGRSRRPREDAVRLGQEARMAFPPTTIRSFTPPDANGPAQLINRFFGFFGPNGPLPVHLTEYARERQINNRDPSFVAFANMLTHRLMSLLYRAWVTGQPAVDFDRGSDSEFESHVAALAGLHGEHLRNRDAMPDLSKRHFSGQLAQGAKNAEGLVALLSSFFHAKFHLQEFVGSWLELEPEDRWQLGAPGGLGQTTSVGTRVWSRAAKFRLIVGPVSLEEYKRLMPGSMAIEKLVAIVRNYVGDVLDWDVNIILRGDQVPAMILGQDARLGYTTWVGERDTNKDAGELYLEPRNLQKN